MKGIVLKKERKLPDKVGISKPIKNMSGQVIFEGTVDQWRAWTRKRIAKGEYIPDRW